MTAIDNSEQFLDDFYNACDPFEPLPAGDPRYVDCKEVQGNEYILARITPILRDESGCTNHNEIFIYRSEQLKGLDCHIVYTAPIAMLVASISFLAHAIEVIELTFNFIRKFLERYCRTWKVTSKARLPARISCF